MKDLLKSKKSLFVIGIILFPIASVDLVLLVFAYMIITLIGESACDSFSEKWRNEI